MCFWHKVHFSKANSVKSKIEQQYYNRRNDLRLKELEREMSDLSLSDVKIFFDKKGKAKEVLMSYETFLQLEVFLKELARNKQTYFVSEEWQNRIREAEADIEAGRLYRVKPKDVQKALDWLDE